ncbi:hypothetical protein H0H81_004932 [Sphagnurus paluster]|uniref:DNA polymerase epsilon subunit B n=1 Tax=Sphagnurus paluster TaxID=117069 RepID=A0A9P7K8Y0_9AGAR|nr:hypothetical protein H0H81_004932 [Sphagnurus paluster]
MSDDRQRRILKVFRKFSYSLGPEVSQKLEEILDIHGIADEEIESTMEMIALEYSKQEDVDMKVDLNILQRVYESMQNQTERADTEKELIDPESHLFIINAFEMPSWHWSPESGTFTKVTTPLTVSGSPESRILAIRDRLHIIKQCVLRNEHFAPSTLPSRDRERLVTLKSTKQLLGRAGDRFLLLGMLTHNKEGKLCIEDSDGSVELDFSKLDEPGDGLFTEGSFALVEGPLDVTINGTIPRHHLLSSLVSRLQSRIPKVHFTTNPCRIKFFDQEIVIFREDTMSRMLRNVVGVKPNVSSEHLKRYLVQTILDQAHLSPLTINIQPTLPDYDHALRLYPLPTVLVLADKYDRYKITYTGCHVFNPGSFISNSFVFSTYKPAETNSEECLWSIRGLYIRAGDRTIRVDRVRWGFSHATGANVKLDGLSIDMGKTQPKSPPPFTPGHRRRLTLADFAPSPMARRLWNLLSSAYALAEPHLRPLIRTCVVAGLRLFIRWLPHVISGLKFEANTTTFTFPDLPGTQVSIEKLTLHATLSFTELEKVIDTRDHLKLPRSMKSRHSYGVAAWRKRFTASFNRSLDRAWGNAQGTASIAVKLHDIGGSMRRVEEPAGG